MSKAIVNKLATRDGVVDLEVKHLLVRDSAMESLGEYEQGIELKTIQQYFTKDGIKFTGKAFQLPLVLSGDWETDRVYVETYGEQWDHDKLYNKDNPNAHDASAISFKESNVGESLETLENFNTDLANPDMGAAMVARGVVAVDSIADLLALPEGQRKEGLRYLVKGYHAGSGVGGGEFYWDESRASENDGGLVLDGYVRSITRPEITPEMFGAIPGGTVDCSDAYDALVAAVPSGTVVVWSGEVYKGRFLSNKALKLVGSQTRMVTSDTYPYFTIRFNGSIGSPMTLTSSPLYGDLSISSTHPDGQLLRLWSGMLRPSDSQRVNFEMIKVSSGNQLTTPVQSDQIGPTPTVSRITPLVGVSIEGFVFERDDDAAAVYVEYADGVVVKDITKRSGTGTAVAIRNSININVAQVRYEYPSATGSGRGYGVAFYNVKSVTVRDITGYGCRHIYDQDSAYNIEISVITDYDPKSSPIALSHNGFAGNVKLSGVRLFGLGNMWGIGTSSQGYNLETDRIIYRDITIRDVTVLLVGDSSHTSPIIYQQQAYQNFSVDNVTVDFPGAYDESVTNRVVVRMNGIPRGKVEVRNVKAYGCNVGVWSYPVPMGVPDPVVGSARVIFDNITVDFARWLVGFHTDNVSVSGLSCYTSSTRKPAAIAYWHGAYGQRLISSTIDIPQRLSNIPVFIPGQLASPVLTYSPTSDASVPLSSGDTISQEAILSRAGIMTLSPSSPVTLSTAAADIVPGAGLTFQMRTVNHPVTVPAGSNLNGGLGLTIEPGTVYVFALHSTATFYRLLYSFQTA